MAVMARGNLASRIADLIEREFPRRVDGKDAISEMKDRGSRNWKQMEWIGWYTEEKLKKILQGEFGGGSGNSVGNTRFDYAVEGMTIDFKSHIKNKPNGGPNNWVILNDQRAIKDTIEGIGKINFLVISGEAEFDKDGDFKRWHDDLKGKKSNYVKQREYDNRPSRMRKKSINFNEIVIIEFSDLNIFERAKEEGWLRDYNQGRNSNGNPREPKYMLKIEEIPDKHILEKRELA